MAEREFNDRDEYLSFINDPANRNRIRTVYLYWYEGVGKRVTSIQPGAHVAKYWDKLDLDEKIRQTFNKPPELLEALRRDYEENGAMTERIGEPGNAVIVVEYDETR